MSERRFRLILAGVMFATLLLPLNLPPDTMPNWLFILWYSVEVLSAMVGLPTTANLVIGSLFLLGILGVPLLILSNVCLAIHPFRAIKMLYRIYLLILLPLTWYATFHIDPALRGVGFWAHIAVVSGAAFVEILFLVSQHLRKPENVDSTVE